MWNRDRGRYENSAPLLRPVAELVAAVLGARVTDVDPAPRLLEVARTAAAEAGVPADFVLGDAAHLPVADHPGWVEAREALEPAGRRRASGPASSGSSRTRTRTPRSSGSPAAT